MADIARDKTKISPVFPDDAQIRTYIAAAAIEAGQAVYVNSDGKVDLADANGVGTTTFRGIALETVGAGQPVSILRRGELYGYTLSAQGFDAPIYVSNTAGELADAAGGTSLQVGHVQPLADAKTIQKVLMIDDIAG